MSKNYLIVAILLIVISLPFVMSKRTGYLKARGNVFFNRYENAFLISVYKGQKTIWLKPPTSSASLLFYEGKHIVFEYKQLSPDPLLNLASATFMRASDTYMVNIKNIQIQEYQLHNFIIVWMQALISIVAFIIAILIWNKYLLEIKKVLGDNIESLSNPLKQDWGIFFFGAALILWAMTAVISLYSKEKSVANACISMLSISNDFLFALSFPFFKHNIPFFRQNRFRYVLVFTTIYLLALMISGYSHTIGDPAWGDLVELYFTVFTFAFLGYLLNESFTQRSSPGTGLIALIFTAIAIYAQIFQFNSTLALGIGEWSYILNLGSFSILVILYVSLVYSWYSEEVKVRFWQEKEIEEWIKKLKNADKEDTETIRLCFRELRARGRIKIPIQLLKEKYSRKKYEEFIDKLISIESRLSYLKSQKSKGVLDSTTLNIEFNKLSDSLNDTVNNFLNELAQTIKNKKK